MFPGHRQEPHTLIVMLLCVLQSPSKRIFLVDASDVLPKVFSVFPIQILFMCGFLFVYVWFLFVCLGLSLFCFETSLTL